MEIFLPGYSLDTLIASHQGTSIYSGFCSATNEACVIKLVMNQLSSLSELTRLTHEYSVLNRIDNVLVPKAHELIRFDGGIALIEQSMGLMTLEQSLVEREKYSVEEGLKFAIKLTNTLASIHASGIIHKDISPSNIVLNEKDNQPVLVDFGISSQFSHQHYDFCSTKGIEGTLMYIAPEQTGRMNRELDYRCDFYSLGAVLYQLFTGQTIFENKEPLSLIYAHLALQPIKVEQLSAEIPTPLSQIIHKLLAKSANDRYQSTYGIRIDLERCLALFQQQGEMSDFNLAQSDQVKKLQQPQKLYGRENQKTALVEAFKSIVNGGSKSIFISGLPGIGKSALVQESHIDVTRFGGYYCSGKFDQLQRTIPYSALLQVCRHLLNQTLLGPIDQFDLWKNRLLDALGHNVQVIVDFLPELKILGPQEPIQALGPAESQNRFNRVIKNFFTVFCRKESPVMLFIDDLQWADLATLKLLEHLLKDADLEYFLLVGCYRSNEIDPRHPFSQLLDNLKDHNVSVESLELGTLAVSNINEMIIDLLPHLSCSTLNLAKILKIKTGGNPFFISQLLKSLNDDGALFFNELKGCWIVDLKVLEEKEISENVVDYMLLQLHKLPLSCQKTLSIASHLGKSFNIDFLSQIRELPIVEVNEHLRVAVEARLVIPLIHSMTITGQESDAPLTIYKSFQFNHDKIQQAAQLLLHIDLAKLHYQIAQSMLDRLVDKPESDYLFDLVDHLSAAEIGNIKTSEGMQFITLSLKAAAAAKQATAYDAAQTYLLQCEAHFPREYWLEHRELAYQWCFNMAEIYYLTNQREQTAPWMEAALELAQSRVEIVSVHNLAVTYLAMAGKYQASFDTALEALKLFDIVINVEDTESAITTIFEQIEQRVNNPQEVAAIFEHSDISDPEMRFAMKILAEITSVSFALNAGLFTLTNATTVLWTLKHGLCAHAAPSFGCIGLIYNALFARPNLGYEYGKLGKHLGERYQNLAQRSKAIDWFCNFNVIWNQPLQDTVPLNREALALSLDTGDLPFAGFIVNHIIYNAFYMGESLAIMQGNCREQLKFLDNISHLYAFDCVQGAAWVVKYYQGDSGELMEIPADKQAFLACCKAPEAMFPLSRYLVLLTQLYVIEHNVEAAWKCACDAESHLPDMVGTISVANQLFYYLMAGIFYYDTLQDSKKNTHLLQLKEKAKSLYAWAERTPENFGHMAELIKAEFARITGQFEDALHHYDVAISQARENGIIHDEALSCERAAKFWQQQGKDRLAIAYIIEAYQSYRQWGCQRKVSYLEQTYSILKSIADKTTSRGLSSSLTTRYSNQDIDLAQLLKSVRAISEATGLKQLLNRTMKILLENAGASRGCLCLARDGELLLSVLAESTNTAINILCDDSIPLIQAAQKWDIPCGLINNVSDSKNIFIINKKEDFLTHLNNEKLYENLPNSVICIPNYKQNELHSIIYLENAELEGAFTPDRIQILKAVSGQMTVSIENALLYEDLENRVRARTSELEQSIKELKYLSMRDPLTSCYNRRAFFEKQEVEWKRANRHQYSLGCIMADADYFKSINDNHGHAVGDDVLKSIATILMDESRTEDCVCRYGGEEFCILVTHSDLQQTAAIAEKYRKKIEALFLGGLGVTISMGVTSKDLGATSLTEMLYQADEALYAAKEAGRNCVLSWKDSLNK